MTHPDEQAAAFVALRADLLAGGLGNLDAHLAALSALGANLGVGPQDQDALARIRAEAERSRDLLAAAAGGVRAALRRLDEAGASSAVYGPDGSRLSLGGARPSSESRA
jgi:hypothetical protein